MQIIPQYRKNSGSKNKVILIASKNEIKDLKLNKKQGEYFTEKIKKDDRAELNEYGVYTIVVKFDKLTKAENKEALRKLGANIYEKLKTQCNDIQIESTNSRAVELFAEGMALASYSFDKYLSEKNKKEPLLKKAFTTNKKANLDQLSIVVEATCWARDLVNEPVSYLTAPKLGEDIVKKCENTGIKTEVFGKQKIESLKMGGLLAVNKGSVDPPVFITMEWKPEKAKNKKPIVLVGKGIVYDTGGLSLKPTANSMDFMKSDMAGSAVMAATIYAAAKQNLPLHIITLIPATDNRPGGNAYAPGDVITMFDGTTVEVMNTDAEGRMALADALAYSNKYKPELVIDAATLTGAAVAAIGEYASISMGNADQSEFDLLNNAGMETYDRVVQFPFWDEYKEELKSPIADLKNLGSRYAGMITAGKFLEHFTKSPYIHIDIAGPSFTHKKTDYRGNGGTGAGVRLLVEFLKQKIK